MNLAAQDADTAIERSAVDHRSAGTAAGSAQPRHVAALPFLAILGFATFAAIAVVLATGYTFPFDQPLLDAGRGLGRYMPEWRGLSDSANLPLIAIGVAIVAGLLLTARRAEALLVIAVLATVTAGSEAVKLVVARPRPPGFDNSVIGVVYSFPSGHVLEAVTIYGIISVLLWRSTLPLVVRVAVPAILSVVVVLVAVARVAVGAHYPSDVLAGLVGGIGIVALFAWLTDLLARRRSAATEQAGR